MNVKAKILGLVAAGLLAGPASATVILSEGFDNIGTLAGAGWEFRNDSTPGGLTGWFQGNSGVFPAASGAADSYIAANYLNAAPGGQISNWLFAPVLNVGNGATLDFLVRVAGLGFLDTLEVYFSAAGASTAVGDFALLGSYSSSTDNGWEALSFTLSGLAGPTSGRFAFRYFVADTNVDGNYIGIDNVRVVPEPGTLALLSLGLAGLGFVRRRQVS
jgi:hypothetical protein